MATTRFRALVPFRTALLVLVLAPAYAQAADPGEAIHALAEFEDACGRAEAIWPVELCGPLVLVHPGTRLAVANQPDPEGEFREREGMFVGEWPAGMDVANTAVDWGGTRWAMVMLPLPEDTFTRLQLLAHESFHRIQPELGFEVSNPMASHLDEEDGRVWLRLEIRALARALAGEDGEAREAVLDGLLFRRVRHASFPGSAPVERRLEAHEGLAEYTGVRFALTVVALGDEGHVYPGAILIGPWGRLTLEESAALATADRDRARVAAPEVPEPGDDGAVNGPGWILELEPGWRLVPGPRPGDYRLEPDPGG